MFCLKPFENSSETNLKSLREGAWRLWRPRIRRLPRHFIPRNDGQGETNPAKTASHTGGCRHGDSIPARWECQSE